MFRRNQIAGLCLLSVLAVLPIKASDDREDENEGRRLVYTMSNGSAANAILVYRQAANGLLSAAGQVATGGKGTGGGLGSQGSLVMSNSKRWLLAVNAGSNDISVLQISEDGLKLASRISSGGTMPISVTISGKTVYVLNAGSPSNITGFRLSEAGILTPLANSTKMLSAAAAGPAQVEFSPDGDILVVTEKATNTIDVFPVSNGIAGTRVSNPSQGATPFGFAFGNQERLFVSEAFGGAANASAASSYNVSSANTLRLISGSVPTTQSAACWLVIDDSGRYAYTTNTGSNTVSLFRIGRNGSLTLDPSIAVTPTGGPIDAYFSQGDRFLNVLTSNAAAIVTFRVQSNGTLTLAGTVSAPTGAAGLVAR